MACAAAGGSALEGSAHVAAGGVACSAAVMVACQVPCNANTAATAAAAFGCVFTGGGGNLWFGAAFARDANYRWQEPSLAIVCLHELYWLHLAEASIVQSCLRQLLNAPTIKVQIVQISLCSVPSLLIRFASVEINLRHIRNATRPPVFGIYSQCST